jgi:hypothetical protein
VAAIIDEEWIEADKGIYFEPVGARIAEELRYNIPGELGALRKKENL